jgi:hypothetical protein
MKALVIYESMFGTTREIAEAIAEGLRGQLEVETVEVGTAGPPPADIDLLVVGGPTHAFSMSRETTRKSAREQAKGFGITPVSQGIGVRDWLDKVGRADGAKAAVFDTSAKAPRWVPTGSAAKAIGKALSGKGYRLIVRPEQFRIDGSNPKLLPGELDRAKAWGADLAARLQQQAA